MAFQCVRCHAEIDRAFKACPHCGEPVTDFLRRYADEPVDGKYRIIERLGAGGMGEVYKVEHVFLKSIRVIKVIRPQISNSTDAHDRFLREAQLATKIQHQNVATLHDFSALPDGSHYMVWEFIQGENLAQVIRRRGVLQPAQAIRLAVQALAGLEAIHRAGIVHRDISPENVMITRDELAKIIDLGVAKGEEGDYNKTQTGIFVGKLRYSSPEQLGFLPEGEKIDGRADLYSLAIVIYEMLTGRPPFEATSPHQYILHHSRETALQPVDLAAIPGGPEFQAVMARALERDRTKRYATAADFADALEKVRLQLPPDADDTLRLTPPAGTTIRTPLPAIPKVATTIRTDVRQKPPAPTVIEKPRRQVLLPLIIIILALALAGLAAWHFWPRPTSVASSGQPAGVAPQPQPQPAPQPTTTTVEVASPAPVPVPVPVPVLAPVAAPEPAPAPVQKKKAVTRPAVSEPEPQPQPAQNHESAENNSEPSQTYIEGGSSSRNDEAMNFARDHLRGVTKVSLDSRGDADLVKQLADLIRALNLTVTEGAPVAIHFYGNIEHLRFGKKRRAAEGRITRNGKDIFRYELKAEEYRVGDNPAEAFARVLSDVFK